MFNSMALDYRRKRTFGQQEQRRPIIISWLVEVHAVRPLELTVLNAAS